MKIFHKPAFVAAVAALAGSTVWWLVRAHRDRKQKDLDFNVLERINQESLLKAAELMELHPRNPFRRQYLMQQFRRQLLEEIEKEEES